MTIVEEQARIALDAKNTAELNIAHLALCPPWRHAAFAGIMAGLVATPAFAITVRFAMLIAIFAAMALIVRADRRRLGVFINGYRRGRTRLVTLPMLVMIMGLYFASSYFGEFRHQPAISLAIAVAAFVVGYFGSVVWQRVFIRELGA